MREPNRITHVEVSAGNKRLRMVLIILLLVIAGISLTAGIMSLLNKDTGWQQVQVNPQERSCSGSFLLQYHFSGSGANATQVNKQVEQVYGEATVKAYQLFTVDEGFADVQNVYYVNQNPNQEISVDPVLYAAFEKLQDTPWLYLGPAYAHYYNVIFNADAETLDDLDPAVSQEAKAFLGKIAAFAGDRNAVRLELLGNNRVKLHVSQEYLAFAQTEEIQNFIDFSYMANAFIIDYLADALISQNLTEGYLVSTDGYTRNLSSGTFSFNLFDRVDDTIYPAGVMHYQGPISIVYLKDYATAPSDANYRVNGNHYVHLFTDPADGLYRTSTENLVSYSYEMGCADVLLKMLPAFVGPAFSLPEDVFTIWYEEAQILYNDDRISVDQLLKSEALAYRAVLQK